MCYIISRVNSCVPLLENCIRANLGVVSLRRVTNSSVANFQSSHRPVRLYRNLFPWKNEIDLAKYLASNVVYNGNNLVAISKPWGVGIYHSDLGINAKNSKLSRVQSEKLLNSRVYGEPATCISDCLEYLSQLLNLPRLSIVKSASREWSGVVLLTTKPDIEPHVTKAIRRAKASLVPHMRFYCITNGIISGVQQNQFQEERCGVRLVEVDEFGEVKEPIYVPPSKMSRGMRASGAHRSNTYRDGPVKAATVQYRTLATNRTLAVSLIELHTTLTKWRFIQCFLAYKATFVLGDYYFSQRVRHILGQPITIPSLKLKKSETYRNLDQSFEPLSRQVLQTLHLKSNREIPLMIHHSGLVLPGLARSLPPHFRSKSNRNDTNTTTLPVVIDSPDLIIEANTPDFMPRHFCQTLDLLDLNVFSNQADCSKFV